MLSCPKAPSPFPLFLTPKASAAIPVRDGLHHDALRQFALDAAVDRIDYVKSVVVAGAPVDINGVVITRGRDRHLVEIVGGDTDLRSLDDDGLYLLAARELNAVPLHLTAGDVRREPRLSLARAIWQEREREVEIDRRMAIADILDRGGPTTVRVLADALGSCVRLEVYALACETSLNIDIGRRPEHAIVSHGPAAAGRGLPLEFEHHYGRRV